ncbi:hypothetical protein ES702_04542 [subsurface metagenome]
MVFRRVCKLRAAAVVLDSEVMMEWGMSSRGPSGWVLRVVIECWISAGSWSARIRNRLGR